MTKSTAAFRIVSKVRIYWRSALVVAVLGLAMVGITPVARAQAESVLYSFAGPTADGANPTGRLIADSQGNLFGTTTAGGAGGCADNYGNKVGCGTVFELVHSNGTYKRDLLYSFSGVSDGSNPASALAMDSNGNLYGTTSGGGSDGYGTVFELVHSNGSYTQNTLYTFTGGTDGGNPFAPLLMKVSSLGRIVLYGTTSGGGDYGDGTVFELVPPATGTGGYAENVLYSFGATIDSTYNTPTDGATPFAGLIMDSSGNLYGTTSAGGFPANCSPSGYNGLGQTCVGDGVVFELSPSSLGTWKETVLYAFQGYIHLNITPAVPDTNDGANPVAGLVMDSSGDLFGTTSSGGYSSNDGTVFEIVNSGGTYAGKVIYLFSGAADGANPSSTLAINSAGELFGTAQGGGVSGKGTAFELAKVNGTYTERTIYGFAGGTDGANPISGLATGPPGYLYGTTRSGGSTSFGTVFDIAVCPVTDTTTTVTSSPNPANAGSSVVLSATVANTCGGPAIGNVEFFDGTTSLGTATLDGSGVGTVTIEDADALGIGTISITAQYTPSFPDFAASTGTGTVTVNEAGVLTNGSNTFTGNQTVNGSVSAQGFYGDGAGLTDLNPAALSKGTAGIDITGHANSATTATTANNSLKLGGQLPGFYATTGANSFTASQMVNGSVSALNFLGNGSGLRNLNPAYLSAGTAGINITGNAATATASTTAETAATATNALKLGDQLPGHYATIGANSFTGNQSVTGNITASNGLAGASVSAGSLTIGSGGTAITSHVSVVFQNVTFNEKMKPTSCTVWSHTFSSAADGDSVVAGLSDSLMSSDIVFSAWAANGTVNLRICNPTGKPTDVGAGSIRIDLWKH